MSAPTNTTDGPLKSPTGAESPTTVRPLEMDDEDVQEVALGDAPVTAKAAEEQAPPKPPRPLSPQQQAENTLKEAFPSIDASVVKAVLIASGGKVEPAFNALLGMTDPDANIEIPPQQPPRPAAPQPVGSTPLSQLEADEQYARQLAEHYGGGGSYGYRGQGSQRGRQETGLKPNEMYDNDHSFIDDDLPVIKENLRKGFLETQNKVNGWITNLKKKIDGDDEESNYNQGGSMQNRKSGYNTDYRRSGDGRRSGDYNRYDADPEVLTDDFAGFKLNQDGSKFDAPRRSTRPLANPDLFKPTPGTPKSADSRKVSFQGDSGDDLYRTSPKLGASGPTLPPKQSKWQPLNAVEPSPIGEAENDPFSLGDSEDEKESKERVGGKEIKQNDVERLKKAAAEAMADSIGEPAKKPESVETVSTKDRVADDKLTGKS